MLIPSIDIQAGRTVQLVGGRELKLDAGDPHRWAERFAPLGPVAVIDLDAAMGIGTNAALVRDLLPMARCRVGGGIRSVDAARAWLDAGAEAVILGTAAQPELLSQLPAERVIAALDSIDDQIVVEGWRTSTGQRTVERIEALKPFVGGFLITFVENEGRLGGTQLARAQALIEAAAPCRVTIAGGITTAAEIAQLDAWGADAQVGMAIYENRLSLSDAFAAPLRSDRPDGLWPTVVVDRDGIALGLAYSSRDSLQQAIETRHGVYHSRRRGLWIKGETSGATQRLQRIDVDCDRDTLRFTVAQQGAGFCHLAQDTCWGKQRGVPGVMNTLESRLATSTVHSYTSRLAQDPQLLRAKIVEEAHELVAAELPGDVVAEAADLLYFTLVKLAVAGQSWSDVATELERRRGLVTRRPGNAKPDQET